MTLVLDGLLGSTMLVSVLGKGMNRDRAKQSCGSRSAKTPKMGANQHVSLAVSAVSYVLC